MDYDVAIIGGGIHGVGVAQAAAASGYKTILIEQYDSLAQGTSSRSSKLIHGGLRYLEQLEFSLVRECLLERSFLLRNAPELVKLKPVYIPIYKHSKRSPGMIRVGLCIYALLGNMAYDARHKKIPSQQWSRLSGLNTDNLQAVFQYYEAQTDDALLTKSVMSSAQKHGAELMLNKEVVVVRLEDDYCVVNYKVQGGIEKSITATTVVNAAGPWASTLINKIQPKQKSIPVDLVQGSHIVLPISLGNNIYYIESPYDQRPIFVMPWYGDTMIGTTESLYKGDPDKTKPLDEEVEYLLTAFSQHFPDYKGHQISIKKQFSGLRVLPCNDKNINQCSRDTIFLQDRDIKPRIISIFGGKLTAYRSTAEQVMRRIKDSLPRKSAWVDTRTLELSRLD